MISWILTAQWEETKQAQQLCGREIAESQCVQQPDCTVIAGALSLEKHVKRLRCLQGASAWRQT